MLAEQGIFLQYIFLLVSLVVLYYGAELVLNSSELVGEALGFSPLVIGVFIIGFGTSLPELFVSHIASIKGHSEIALGNIIGSNVTNTFLVLGVAAMMVPLRLNQKGYFNQFLVHLLLCIVLFTAFFNKVLHPYHYFILLSIFGLALFVQVLQSLKQRKLDKDDGVQRPRVGPKVIFKLFCGFVMLYYAGDILVNSGSRIGIHLGISEYVLSSIVVAFGTSFPELITAVMACLKKKDTGLIIGNVVGSNLFNGALVLGSLGVYQIKVEGSYWIEIVVLLAATVVFLAWSSAAKHMYRFLGSIFLATYVAMLIYWISQN